MIDLDAARAHLREELDEPIEIEDPNVLDAAAAVVTRAAQGLPQSEAPGSSRPGLATSEKELANAAYLDSTTRAS